jgi:outer membrane protein TolC
VNRILYCVLMVGIIIASIAATAFAQGAPRVGVDGTKTRTLTLREAITMAFENNHEIEIERLKTQSSDYDLRAAKGIYDPALSTSFTYDHRNTPVASLLAGSSQGGLQTTEFSGSTTITQRLPWQGGTASVSFDQNRGTTQNQFFAFNPQYSSTLTFEFAQPLWRNRAIDSARRDIKIAQKRLDLSDSQFRQRAIEIIAQVERAYWDLVFACRDNEIKRESVERACTQLEHNQRLAAQGTLAQADVISARVEVERRTDEAEASVEAIQRAENSLKALVLQPSNSEAWNATLTPVEKPEVDTSAAMPFEDAVKLALHNRPEMEQFRLQREVNQVDVAFLKNQTKPQVDLIASYGTYGLAGKQRTTTNPIVESNALILGRLNELSQIAGLQPIPSFSFGTTPEKFNGGYGQSLQNLFGNDYRAWRVGININFSFRNRTAKAQLGRALTEGRRIDVERERAEQRIEVEVRNALQSVETAKRRVEAARNSRHNAELQLKSEQNRFAAGLSTSFFVLDRQNALSSAEGRELKALTDYSKATSELQRSLSNTLVSNNITVVGRENSATR